MNQQELISHLVDIGTIFYQKCDKLLEVIGRSYYDEDGYQLSEMILEVSGCQHFTKEWDKCFGLLESIGRDEKDKSDFLQVISPKEIDPQDFFSKVVRVCQHIRNKEEVLFNLFEIEGEFDYLVGAVAYELEKMGLRFLGFPTYPEHWTELQRYYNGEITFEQLLIELQQID